MRRAFNRTERRELWVAADGRCQECGVELGPGWHADHRVPFSLGGATRVENGQALCGPCNLSKGAAVNLRRWQSDVLRAYVKSRPRDYLLMAVPGAGKTTAAGAIAAALLGERAIERVIVVVPRRQLKAQWADSLERQGIIIHDELRLDEPRFADDKHGAAITYQQLKDRAAAEALRRVTTDKPTLVILDEIHHCGDDDARSQWGRFVRQAFEGAAHRLALSGTPFRSDGTGIPFVRYEASGQVVMDYTYTYADALHDQVVRKVMFHRTGGDASWIFQGEAKRGSFATPLPRQDQRHLLRTATRLPRGGWMATALDEACAQLRTERRHDPKAAGLVIAASIHDAGAICDELKGRGHTARVVTSAEDAPTDLISSFRRGTDEWLVSVAMVSEGVDIPRLRVLVYATNVTTRMFFQQAIGRVIRRTRNDPQPLAHVFLPDDEQLRAHAHELPDAVAAFEKDVSEQDPITAGERERASGDRAPASDLVPLTSNGSMQGSFTDDLAVPGGDWAHVRALTDRFPELEPGTAARMLAAGVIAAEALPRIEQQPTRREQEKQLKDEIRVLVGKIAFKDKVEPQRVHAVLNENVGCYATAHMSLEQLERKRQLAENALKVGLVADAFR